MLKFRPLLAAARAGSAVAAGAFAFATPAQAQAETGSGPPLWLVLLLVAVFLGVAGLIGYFMVRQLRSALASRNWRAALGTVLSGTVQAVSERHSDGTST